ncbi:MAG: DUF4082 domain-containing protein [Planctomycetes bacterium]|nr:DUF4082 domain-containing protein [Planctomycetota bacterium]
MPDCNDGCPNDPLKSAPGDCGCGVPYTDSDADGTPDCNDGCPNDPLKLAPGTCGCGVADVDTDADGVPDCNDGCPNDPLKLAPGACGCGAPDTDTDADGVPDCNDGCPLDPLKSAPGDCGCGVPETDSDADGVPNCIDGCPNDPLKLAPGACGCGTPDTDTDADGVPDCNDGCPNDPLKSAPGDCGCGVPDTDSDADGVPNCLDGCPNDPLKLAPGACGCGTPDIDSDADGALDCNDGCPNDPNKVAPGLCGCGVPENPITFYRDADGDGHGDAQHELVACSPPPGFVLSSDDCDDTRATTHPLAAELCANELDDDCDAMVDEETPHRNPIVAENLLPGTPRSEWDVAGAGDPSIQGFASPFSVNHGTTVQFKIKTDSAAYHIDIYRLGYYGGLGARRITTITPAVALPQTQPVCLQDPSSGLIDCGNWTVSAFWNIPGDAVSGVYLARPVRDDGANAGKAAHIPFVVRADGSCGGLLFQTSDTTWQAYNSYGGASLYVDHVFGLPAGRASKVSYNRPFATRNDTDGIGKRDYFFWAEYPMIRWLEANGYRVTYASGIDSATRGADLLDHDAFLSIGHDEYWSGEQRANVEAARDAGVDLLFLSGNECFWKTRWEPSKVDRTPNRTLVCYKETHSNARMDPTPGVWTGTWRDPRFASTTDGGRPENALMGTQFMVNGPRNDNLTVPATYGRMRLWRNTAIATMPLAQTAFFPAGLLGHEWDADVDNGSRPAGLVSFSRTNVYLPFHYLFDNGSTYGTTTATHALTMYRAPSGALVFSAGTVQWSWGLDEVHDGTTLTPDNSIRQVTVNVLADMGLHPESLRAPLVPASASLDETPPRAWIVEPRSGATVPGRSGFWIEGRATDSGGGLVGAVEVSIDGGRRWHPATGRDPWSFHVPPGDAGPMTILCRATDDSLNMQARNSAVVVVRSGSDPAPLHLFAQNGPPPTTTSAEMRALEVGVRFKTSVPGVVTGVRFYKGAGNVGRHIAHLWASNGTLLAAAEYRVETESGWQEVEFDNPVAIQANVLYTASYHAQCGHVPIQTGYFLAQDVQSGPLLAPRATGSFGNGVFKYGAAAFPTDSSQGANYWVDVSFRPNSDPYQDSGH